MPLPDRCQDRRKKCEWSATYRLGKSASKARTLIVWRYLVYNARKYGTMAKIWWKWCMHRIRNKMFMALVVPLPGDNREIFFGPWGENIFMLDQTSKEECFDVYGSFETGCCYNQYFDKAIILGICVFRIDVERTFNLGRSRVDLETLLIFLHVVLPHIPYVHPVPKEYIFFDSHHLLDFESHMGGHYVSRCWW